MRACQCDRNIGTGASARQRVLGSLTHCPNHSIPYPSIWQRGENHDYVAAVLAYFWAFCCGISEPPPLTTHIHADHCSGNHFYLARTA
jgi:hypothetical protein